ncbi:MAG: M18 family aminopeptidase, partial [Longicatena sp.]
MYKEVAQELLTFIQKSPSCFHAVQEMKELLKEAGYTQVKECETWSLKKGGKYFTIR